MRYGISRGGRTILMGAVLTVTAFALGAAPAGASAASCPAERVCVFEGVNFTGAQQVVSAPDFGNCEPLSIVARSGINNTDASLGVERFGCGIVSDWTTVLGPGASDPDFGGTGSGLSRIG